MSDDDMVTITVRREDIEEAIGALATSHAEFCTSSYCTCGDADERLSEALEAATAIGESTQHGPCTCIPPMATVHFCGDQPRNGVAAVSVEES